MKVLGNIVWLVFGGLETSIGYFVSSVLLMITIIGIPFGIASMRIGLYVLWPFGQRIVNQHNDYGCLDLIMNVIWLFAGGIYISLAHVLFGLLLCLTIIGIPFGKKQFHLARLALAPFGKRVIAV